MKILSGNSNIPLAQNISKKLGVDLINADIKRFADMEVFVEIKETVRGQDLFVIQSTSYPANDNIMELLVCLDALKRASARRITAVIPYFGYARQDRKSGPGTPISAKLVADIIVSSGAHRVLTLDLHANQIQGFFNIPVDNLYAAPVFARHIKDLYTHNNIVVVSPDIGGVVRARDLANRINADIAIVDKVRAKAGISRVMHIIGDVQGKDCILIDDIVDSAGTLCNAANALVEKGAKSVVAYVTHGILSGDAYDKIKLSKLSKLYLTDSIQLRQEALTTNKIEIVSASDLLAESMSRISNETSISNLFY